MLELTETAPDTLSLRGALDVKTVAQARDALEARLARPLTLNLSALESVDTAGVQLLTWLKRRPGVNVQVVASSEAARTAFHALGLDAEVAS